MLTVVNGDTNGGEMTVVMLHGYGMQPEDFAPFVRSMGVPGRYHFPRGSLDVVAGGRAWWPIDEAKRDDDRKKAPRDLVDQYPPQRARARQEVSSLIRDAQLCTPGRPLVLMGFSQGAMLACDTLLHEDIDATALVMMSSSRLAIADWDLKRERLIRLPVLVSHGRTDTDLAFQAGERLRDWLQDSEAAVEWVPFDGGHETPLIVWREVRRLLRSLQSTGPSL